MGGATEEPTQRRTRIGAGRAGPIRAALRRAVAEARADDRMTTEHDVRALLAERYAAVVDEAAKNGEDAAMLRAGQRLLELMDTLPIRKPSTGGGDAGDGSGPRGRVLELIDSGPSLGDGAHS